MTDRDIRGNIAESRDIWLASLPDYDAQPSELLPDTRLPIKEMVRRRHAQKLLLKLLIAALMLLLCAFAIIPNFGFISTEGDEIDVSYPQGARQEAQSLTIVVDYESYGEGFEIIKHMTVAVDPDFKNILDRIDTSAENGLYRYTYEAPAEISQVYISPPVIYTPVPIEPEYYPLISETSQKTDTEKWFTVEEVVLNGISCQDPLPEYFSTDENSYDGEIAVTVQGDGSGNIPRLPKLVIDGREYGSTSTVQFDEEANFGKAVFTFPLPSELYNLTSQQLSSARILVSEAMARAVAVPQGLFQSSSITLTVIND